MTGISAGAQDLQISGTGMATELRRRALVLEVNTRVLDDEKVVIWSETLQRIAIPGSPVGIRLAGSNIAIFIQFTPFMHRQGNVLVAHGQVWVNEPGKGVNYYTSIQTIPIDFNEPIYYFPLGAINSSIEILLSVSQYSETAAINNSNTRNDN